jgi:hypothetical protein
MTVLARVHCSASERRDWWPAAASNDTTANAAAMSQVEIDRQIEWTS